MDEITDDLGRTITVTENEDGTITYQLGGMRIVYTSSDRSLTDANAISQFNNYQP